MNQTKDVIRRQSGFSLVETLISMVIFAVGLLAVGAMQITSIKTTSVSYHITGATLVAQTKLEELKRLPYDNAALTNGEHQEGGLSGSIFSRKYTVEDITSTLKAITVTVQWVDKVSHRISLSTLRAK